MTAWTSGHKTRNASKGWVSGNAPCCVHNGETADSRGRGAFIVEGDRISWHCFNCGFKTGWASGWHLGYKMRKLMSWIGIDEGEIKRMVFEAMRVREYTGVHDIPKQEIEINFKPRALPEDAKTIDQWLQWYAMSSSPDDYSNVPDDLCDVISYADNRGLSEDQTNQLYWTPKKGQAGLKMNRRVIIPFTYENKLIGYTARAIDAVKMKYYNQYEPNYVYGIDTQIDDAIAVIVMEGPLDAAVINGVAVLGNDISETQVEIIEQLNREVIVVPDKGKAGQKLIDHAIEYGWSVSFPEWADESIDDVNSAVQKYGKLFVLKHIFQNKETSKLKIQLLRKKYK